MIVLSEKKNVFKTYIEHFILNTTFKNTAECIGKKQSTPAKGWKEILMEKWYFYF